MFQTTTKTTGGDTIGIEKHLGIGDFFKFGGQEGGTLGDLISQAIDVMLAFGVILSLIYLTWGSVSWITSGSFFCSSSNVFDNLPEKSNNAPNGHTQEQNARPTIKVKIINASSEKVNNDMAGDEK